MWQYTNHLPCDQNRVSTFGSAMSFHTFMRCTPRAFDVVPHLRARVRSFLCRPPRCQFVRPDHADEFIRVAVAGCGTHLFMAHSMQVHAYALAASGIVSPSWDLLVRGNLGTVELFADEATHRVLVVYGSTLTLVSCEGLVLAVHQRLSMKWMALCYDFGRDELYAIHENCIQVETLAGHVVRRWGQHTQWPCQLKLLGHEGWALAYTSTGFNVVHTSDGAVAFQWWSGGVWDFAVHDGVVLAACVACINLFRVCDGTLVGQWRFLRNIDAMAVTRGGRLMASAGWRVYVQQFE